MTPTKDELFKMAQAAGLEEEFLVDPLSEQRFRTFAQIAKQATAQPAPVPLTNTEFCEQWFKQTGRIMGTDKQLLLQAKRVTEAAHGITASPKNRKDALRKLLLSEDGLTAQECEWVNEVNEGDKVKLRGGQSVAVVKSVYRQKGLAPDYYTLILANGDTLDLSGDEIADIYEPAAPEKGQP
jgi:hypothetical protein